MFRTTRTISEGGGAQSVSFMGARERDSEKGGHGYTGIIARVRGPVADVLLDGGQVVSAIPRGTLKRERRGTLIAVGDRVRLIRKSGEDWLIDEVAPRERALVRRWPDTLGRQDVIVANPDQALFMFAVRDPHPRLQMLDRLLVIAEDNDIPAGVIVNKIDLDEAGEAREIFGDYERAGYPVHYISVQEGIGLDDLRPRLKGLITVLAGPSGVGKSSLINALEPTVQLPVAEISRKWRQGRHTTVMAQLIPLREGGYIVDTPGLREVGLWGVDVENLDYYFPEFRPYLGRCYFNDCRHLDEPGCAIVEAVEKGEISLRRYESYVNILLSEGG